mmetsp:Transcript_4885/g.11634  ORF Transcript_4885/g.11634 Transcript_4885/m.11634 type:complete len:477 (-) Transcript_4885:163-1593(-)
MIYVSFRNEDHCNLNHLVEGSNALPDHGVSKMIVRGDISDLHNAFTRFMHLDCDTLTQMLKQSPNKIERVCLDHRENVSPEYLALLISLSNKAETLQIQQLEGDAAYSCLMAGLLQSDGPRKLVFRCRDSISLHQAHLLFKGIAFSPSLEKLLLSGEFEPCEDIGRTLVDSLGRNRRLKRLELSMDILDMDVEGILRTATLETQVQSLGIFGSEVDDIPLNILRDVLCREDCPLEQFNLFGVAPSSRPVAMNGDELNTTLVNSSVKGCSVINTIVDCSRIMETIGLFQSIETLFLFDNGISDLSPLDPLLIGDNATLKSLVVCSNDIEEADAIDFFRKLPEMKRLRHVRFWENPFITGNNDSWKTMAIDAIQRNKSLECIEGDQFDEHFIDKTKVALSLNRGGRRALEVESSSVLPANLWPRVLERATNIVYCDYSISEEEEEIYYESEAKSEPVESTRVDVVFWLLREKMVGQCL